MSLREEEFIRKIDCHFPYDDQEQALSIIEEGCSLSSSAAFMILFELSNPGRNASYEKSMISDYLAHWSALFEHPLKEKILFLVNKKLNGEFIADEELIEGMLACSDYPGSLNALNTIYNSKFSEANDIEELYTEIVKVIASAQEERD